MFAICVNRADQLPQGHASLAGDFLEAVPELVFKADARLITRKENRTLANRRLHGFSPRRDEIERGPCLTVARIKLKAVAGTTQSTAGDSE